MEQDLTWIKITNEPLRMSEVEHYLYNERAGGVNVFVGVTRAWTGDQQTSELSYECYRPMAEKEMKRLLIEAVRQWPIVKACMLHRIGRVDPGEPSVIIGVATPHRNESFEACRFLIDSLKTQVPIWKKETYSDGTKEWVNPMGEE